MSIRHIRPYQLFSVIEAPACDRVVHVKMPQRKDLTLLETFLLLAAIRIVDAHRIFEFGTFLGSTTFNLALNAPEDAEIFTLDLAEMKGSGQHPLDAQLSEVHMAAKQSLDFIGTSVARKIVMLSGDSILFDFSPWERSIDLVFVDGGHDFATLKADTESALRMVRDDRLSCIAWHDYHHPDYPDVTAYLDQLSNTLDIVHVEDTILCLSFSRGVLP